MITPRPSAAGPAAAVPAWVTSAGLSTGERGRQRLGVDHGEQLGGTGEGDVEGPQALGLLGEHGGRLHHDGGVKLETLHQRDRYDRDLVVEALLDRPTVVDARRGERVADL